MSTLALFESAAAISVSCSLMPMNSLVPSAKIWKMTAPAERRIYVTRGFAAEIGEFLGDEVVIVAPRMHLTPFGPVPVTKRFVISQLVVQGSEENAPEAWLPFDSAANLFGTDGGPTGVHTVAVMAGVVLR